VKSVKMNPAISIIVPIYNLETYLEKCVESILAQTFTDIEVILVNDGSTDRSGRICDRLVQQDSRINVIHKEYGGVSSARNVGVEASKGEFIGFVDGDDRIDLNMYQTLYKLCKSTGSDISICKLGREVNGKLINEDSKNFIKELDHNEAMRQLFKGILYRFSLCNKLFKKSCFNNVTFPEGRIHEDLSTTYKLFANANKVIYINYLGYIYIKRENSILTKRYNEKRLEAFMGWDEILPFMKEYYPSIYQEVITCFTYWTIDNVHYANSQVANKEERKEYLQRIRIYIRKYYKDILKIRELTQTYRSHVKLLNYNLSLFNFVYQINSLVKSKT
jgi:glycosyltransferase involved in cell wall biosynthesis